MTSPQTLGTLETVLQYHRSRWSAAGTLQGRHARFFLRRGTIDSDEVKLIKELAWSEDGQTERTVGKGGVGEGVEGDRVVSRFSRGYVTGRGLENDCDQTERSERAYYRFFLSS